MSETWLEKRRAKPTPQQNNAAEAVITETAVMATITSEEEHIDEPSSTESPDDDGSDASDTSLEAM